MSPGSAMPAEPAPSAPWIRNQDLVDYFERIIVEKRAQNVTIGQLCERGEISLAQFKRWRGIGGPQSIPEPDNLIGWCVGNDLDPTEPLELLGWTPASAGATEIRQALAEAAAALDDPNLTAEDAEEFTQLLNILTEQLRAKAARRNTDERRLQSDWALGNTFPSRPTSSIRPR